MVSEVRFSGALVFATVKGVRAAQLAQQYGVRLPIGTSRYSFSNAAFAAFKAALSIA